jgi:glyoxylase I family protein
MSDLQGFHHVGLSVRDLDASIDWYTDVLGLHVRFLEPGEERRAAVLNFADGRFAVGLSEHRGNTSDFDPAHTGLDHLGFSVATREDLDEWHERLTAAGVTTSEPIEIPSGAIMNFKDPDGIALALFWERG